MPKLPDKIKNLPFEQAVRLLFNTEVMNFCESGDLRERLVPILESCFKEMCVRIRDNPIKHTRVNEIGNMLEPHVIDALSGSQIRAEAARTKAGGGQSTAYPDVYFEFNEKCFYLEVKSLAARSADSKLRSFYMSPSDNPKVHKDAFHLVVGFEMRDLGPTSEMRDEKALHAYVPDAFEIVDLYGMHVDLKAEFNSDNYRMYQEDRVLVRLRLGDGLRS